MRSVAAAMSPRRGVNMVPDAFRAAEVEIQLLLPSPTKVAELCGAVTPKCREAAPNFVEGTSVWLARFNTAGLLFSFSGLLSVCSRIVCDLA